MFNCARLTRFLSLWAFCLAFLVPILASAGDLEYRVKGGYLFNFTKFVDWPAEAFSSSNAPIVICILGDDPFGFGFDEAMKGETSHGRRIEIRRVKSVDDVGRCHIVFVSRSEGRLLPDILKQFRNANILTVGEGGGFVRMGGVLEFVILDGKVRFSINVDAEKRAGLKISSDLKRVATEIVRE